MLKIQFSNTNTEVEYLSALETEEFFNGSSRRTLTITCAPDAISLDALNALLTEENLASVTLVNTSAGTDEEGNELTVTNVYDGYVLKLSCGIRNELVQAETPDRAAVYEDRLVFKLGKRTYIEEQLHKLGL